METNKKVKLGTSKRQQKGRKSKKQEKERSLVDEAEQRALLLARLDGHKRHKPHPGFSQDGLPSKDVFSRRDKVEQHLNGSVAQRTFALRRNIVVYSCTAPYVEQNPWDPPKEVPIDAYAAAAMERIIETATTVMLSTTVCCPLCGITPPCSHRDATSWLATCLENRDENFLIQKRELKQSSDFGTKSQSGRRDETIPPWVAQIRNAYKKNPERIARETRRTLTKLRKYGRVKVDCNKKLTRNLQKRWIPKEYEGHPMLQAKPPFELIKHIERYDGSRGLKAMKFNYNHVLHNHDPHVSGFQPITTLRCGNCTLPLTIKETAKARKFIKKEIANNRPIPKPLCTRCKVAKPSAAMLRNVGRDRASALLYDFCVREQVPPP